MNYNLCFLLFIRTIASPPSSTPSSPCTPLSSFVHITSGAKHSRCSTTSPNVSYPGTLLLDTRMVLLETHWNRRHRHRCDRQRDQGAKKGRRPHGGAGALPSRIAPCCRLAGVRPSGIILKADLRVIASLQVKQVNTFGLIAARGLTYREWSTSIRAFAPERRVCTRHN